MNIKKIVFLFYIIYTVYVLLLTGSTTLSLFHAIISLLMMWINYLFFNMGFNFRTPGKNLLFRNVIGTNDVWVLNQTKLRLFILALVSLICSFIAVYYYTGQTPIKVFENIFNDVSVYYEYQNYFSQQKRYAFSLEKIPFILMLFFVKFLLIYSFTSFLIIKNMISLNEKIYLIIVCFAHIYIGIGRGTNFEFFELLILLLYIMFSRYKRNKSKMVSFRAIINSLILSTLGIIIYFSSVSARGYHFNIYNSVSGITYDPNGWLSSIFPILSYITFGFYGYFGFGFYYISSFVTHIWSNSFLDFLLGLMPLGYQLYSGNSIQKIMENIVDVGVKWHPDFSILINHIGYLGVLLFLFFIGYFSKYISCRYSGSLVELTNYIILLQMISLPVGNFVLTSSANKIILLLIIFYWFWKIFIRKKIIVR